MYNNTLMERYYINNNGIRVVTRTQYVPIVTDAVIACLKSGKSISAGTTDGYPTFIKYITNPFMVGL